MADRLEAEGFPVYPVPLGSQLGCIDRKAGEISKYLDAHGLEDGAFFFFLGGGGGGVLGWDGGVDWIGWGRLVVFVLCDRLLNGLFMNWVGWLA